MLLQKLVICLAILSISFNECSGDITLTCGSKDGTSLKGPPGEKGEKGESGDSVDVSDVDKQLLQLEKTVSSIATDLSAGYTELQDGWIGLYNRYQYKLTSTAQSYSSSRTLCQQFGGDLVVYGMQDMMNRRTLERALNLVTEVPCTDEWWQCDSAAWIGLDDLVNEGYWIWVNGYPATPQTALWYPGEPTNDANREDCVRIISGVLMTNDVPCTLDTRAICEKPWNE